MLQSEISEILPGGYLGMIVRCMDHPDYLPDNPPEWECNVCEAFYEQAHNPKRRTKRGSHRRKGQAAGGMWASETKQEKYVGEDA